MLHERHTFFELWRKILLVKTPLLKWNRSHCIGFDHFDQLPGNFGACDAAFMYAEFFKTPYPFQFMM